MRIREIAAAALALACAAGCGSHHGSARVPGPPLRTGTAPDGNPYPIATDLRLPPRGDTRIPHVAAPPGQPRSCAPRGPSYVETAPATRRRVVALTLDDGPSGYTPKILAILEHKHVHATFFVIGSQVADHPDLLRRELDDGDAIGVHTWTHADMTLLPPSVQSRQLTLTQQAIAAATGFRTCFWRAPYGAIDGRIETLARGLGLISAQWDVDPQDYTEPPVAAIVRRVLYGNPQNPDRGVRPGSIVLMHDGGGDRSHTIAALPRVIDGLRARGYRFETLPVLLHLPIERG